MKSALKSVLVFGLVLVAATSAWAQAAGNWQEIHGVVQSVQGNQLTLKVDDGRVINVDMAQVSPAVRGAMHPNMGVSVSGFPGPSRDRFTARYITQDQAGSAAQAMAKDPNAVINRVAPLVLQFADSQEFRDRAAAVQRNREVVDGFVSQLYRAFMEREPSEQERTHWGNHLRQTGDLKGTVEQFMRSPEYAAKRKTEQQVIGDLYQAFFGRTPSSAEINAWQGRLARQ
ncbi:MAG: DUF4214 domain-containing protein [Tepidiformaceae bacterium]